MAMGRRVTISPISKREFGRYERPWSLGEMDSNHTLSILSRKAGPGMGQTMAPRTIWMLPQQVSRPLDSREIFVGGQQNESN